MRSALLWSVSRWRARLNEGSWRFVAACCSLRRLLTIRSSRISSWSCVAFQGCFVGCLGGEVNRQIWSDESALRSRYSQRKKRVAQLLACPHPLVCVSIVRTPRSPPSRQTFWHCGRRGTLCNKSIKKKNRFSKVDLKILQKWRAQRTAYKWQVHKFYSPLKVRINTPGR